MATRELSNGDLGPFSAQVLEISGGGEAAGVAIISADGTASTVTARGLKVWLDGLPAAAALTDAITNPTTHQMGANLLAWDTDSNQWKRVRGTAGVLQTIINSGTVTVDDSTPIDVAIPDGVAITSVDPLEVDGEVATIQGEYGAPDAIASTTLNSVAEDGVSTATAQVDNTDTGYAYADVELVLGAYTTEPTVGGTIELYLLAAPDGTNFATGGGGTLPPDGAWWCSFDVLAADNQRLVLHNLPIPPCPFKVCAVNYTDQTTPASGNALNLYRHS